MFPFQVPFSRIGVQSSNNSSVSLSQELEVIYFGLTPRVVCFPREVALSVVVCSPLVSLVLCQQEASCSRAGPAAFPGTAHFFRLLVSQTENAFFFLGKLEFISRYLAVWMWAFNRYKKADQLGQLLWLLWQVPKGSPYSGKPTKARSKIEHLIILGFKLSRFGGQQTSFSVTYRLGDFPSCFSLCKEKQEMWWCLLLMLGTATLTVPSCTRMRVKSRMHYEKKIGEGVLRWEDLFIVSKVRPWVTHLTWGHFSGGETRSQPANGARLGVNSFLSGVSLLWMERRERSALEKNGLMWERFFCSRYPLSAMETGTEAMLSAASEIGSLAIVLVVTPAALLGSAC